MHDLVREGWFQTSSSPPPKSSKANFVPTQVSISITKTRVGGKELIGLLTSSTLMRFAIAATIYKLIRGQQSKKQVRLTTVAGVVKS